MKLEETCIGQRVEHIEIPGVFEVAGFNGGDETLLLRHLGDQRAVVCKAAALRREGFSKDGGSPPVYYRGVLAGPGVTPMREVCEQVARELSIAASDGYVHFELLPFDPDGPDKPLMFKCTKAG